MASAKFRPIPVLPQSYIDLFHSNLPANRPGDGCWEWEGNRTKDYGRLNWRGLDFQAHRLSYFIFKGEDPGEMAILHTCDNPPCVNPKHLQLGTLRDNVHDRIKKGRFISRGTRREPLSKDEVEAMRAMAKTLSIRKVAEAFQVPNSTAYNAIRCYRNSWSDIPNPVTTCQNHSRGDEHKSSKLTTEVVRIIRARVAAGETMKSMAILFGVRPQTIRCLIVRSTWKHVG